ncbi:MAG TPA: ASCH domain-containing protein [Cellulomonadaceae bacterium]|nr:ASCH domain-containing protein [Cellulomonadaceae bacterium]
MTTDGELAGDPDEIASFWELARGRAGFARLAVVTGTGAAASVVPPAWAFGDVPEIADELVALVLAGVKTATVSPLWEYQVSGTEVPAVGDLSIVLDGRAHPRALIRTSAVRTARFDEVDAAHAWAEGEGDRSLESWRAEHEAYYRRLMATRGVEFRPDMELVLEAFELRFPPRPSGSGLARPRTGRPAARRRSQ